MSAIQFALVVEPDDGEAQAFLEDLGGVVRAEAPADVRDVDHAARERDELPAKNTGVATWMSGRCPAASQGSFGQVDVAGRISSRPIAATMFFTQSGNDVTNMTSP